jgi:hypothetical protein
VSIEFLPGKAYAKRNGTVKRWREVTPHPGGAAIRESAQKLAS